MKEYVKTLTIKISDDAHELLKDLEKEGQFEYRDNEYPTVEEYVSRSPRFKSGNPEELIYFFRKRNANGTYHLMLELESKDLVEEEDGSWHTTFVLSDLGREFLKEV